MGDILIAEDDKFLAKIYATKFKKIGLAVDIAEDGQAALDMMKKDKPKLLLLDLIMPKVDGFEVMQKMNADPALKKIPVLVLSNLGQESDIEKAEKLGAKEFIIKSDMSIAEVVKKIQSHLK
ncbi:response regulator [Patescibacteria group bacterium]|nr:response regulator [Patescibacteria group bacterium]